MESSAKYTLVGAALVIVTVMFVGFILWIRGSGVSESTVFYTIYFKHTSLYGLQKNSDVTMKGIKVGSVTSFNISRENIEKVKVTVGLDPATPVKTDTKAVINRNLLTGFASIDLTGSSQESLLLATIEPGESYPVIPEGKSELDEIAGNLPGLLQEVAQMAKRASLFFSEENRRALTDALASTAKFADALARNTEGVQSLIARGDTLAQNLDQLSKSLNRLSNSSEKEIGKVSGQFVAALKELEQTSKTLQQESIALSKSMRNAADVFVVQSSSVADDISRAARTFSATMEKFEDPQSALLGPSRRALGPGEENKR